MQADHPAHQQQDDHQLPEGGALAATVTIVAAAAVVVRGTGGGRRSRRTALRGRRGNLGPVGFLRLRLRLRFRLRLRLRLRLRFRLRLRLPRTAFRLRTRPLLFLCGLRGSVTLREALLRGLPGLRALRVGRVSLRLRGRALLLCVLLVAHRRQNSGTRRAKRVKNSRRPRSIATTKKAFETPV